MGNNTIIILIMIIHVATKVAVIPIVIGAHGTISKNAKVWYGRLSLPDIFGSVQLSAILGTAHILRKVLCLKTAGSCQDMAEKTQKKKWRESQHNNNSIKLKSKEMNE